MRISYIIQTQTSSATTMFGGMQERVCPCINSPTLIIIMIIAMTHYISRRKNNTNSQRGLQLQNQT